MTYLKPLNLRKIGFQLSQGRVKRVKLKKSNQSASDWERNKPVHVVTEQDVLDILRFIM